MPLVSAHGICQYGSFNFGPYTETVGMDVKPKYDSSGRTVVANVYTFTFVTILTSATTTDAQVTAAIQALSKPGDRFHYTGRGLGTVTINQGARRDVDWGPKPETLSFVPRGKDRAAKLTWRLTVTVPDCPDAKYRYAFMEFGFDVQTAVTKGYTDRTINVHFQIPVTRVGGAGGRILDDTADLYLENIIPPMLPGFRRKYGPRKLNEAKNRLDISITDEEMGANVPPVGIVEATATHTMGSSQPGLVHWTGTLTADYELTKGGDARLAAEAFLSLCRDRIGVTAKTADSIDPDTKIVTSSAKSILPVTFTFRENDLYARERRVGFDLSYTFVCRLSKIFEASGLYRPVPGSNWQQWSAAIESTALSPRGYAALVFDVKDDRIIDLCDAKPNVIYGGGGQAPTWTTELRSGGANPPRPPSFPDPNGVSIHAGSAPSPFAQLVREAFPEPKADGSWAYYETELFLECEAGVIPMTTLPTKALSKDTDLFGNTTDFAGQPWDAMKGRLPPGSQSNPGIAPRPDAGDTSAQRRVRPLCYVYLRGRAARAKYPVSVPRLVTIGGVPAVPANRLDRGEGFASGVSFTAGETPLYTGRWNLRYALASPPKTALPVPPNPIMGNPPGFVS